MKNKFCILLLLIASILFIGCNESIIPSITESYTVTIEYNNGEKNYQTKYNDGQLLIIDDDIIKEGYVLCGWYLDKDLTIPLGEDFKVTSDITVYAKWEVLKYTVTFYVDDEVYDIQEVEQNGRVTMPKNPEKDGLKFSYWSTGKSSNLKFFFSQTITKDRNLYAKFEAVPIEVTYDLGFDAFLTKDDLYKSFFGDFYDFMIANTDVNMTTFNIKNKEDFYDFCLDWNAGSSNGLMEGAGEKKSDLYGVGDAFSKYYICQDIGGKLENQPTTHFIGYCYQNGKYLDFIPFLMQFFAYWRTDEGYTGGADDPNNTGNDFFASPWASLVDTCKFFFFTSSTLHTKYPWFNSERVMNALDNIPGVYNNLPITSTSDNPITLPKIERYGYIFLGWFDDKGNQVTIASESIKVTAKWSKA